MNKRLKIDQYLKQLFGSAVSVYFQPPSNIELTVPACIYSFDSLSNSGADNGIYVQTERYTVKMIVKSLEDPVVLGLMKNSRFSYITFYPSGVAQYSFIFKISV